MTDNRKHRRERLEGISVYLKNIFNSEIEVLDISAGGASIRGTKRFNVGGNYAFKFGHKDRVLAVQGTIVWAQLSGSKNISYGETMPIYTMGINFSRVLSDEVEQFKEFILGVPLSSL
jgi:hypothetical protein